MGFKDSPTILPMFSAASYYFLDPLAAPIIIRPVQQTLNCTKFDDSLILLKCI